MMLSETTVVPAVALPIDKFKEHLRLGTGFTDDDVQDALAEGYLRAALAAIEGRIGKALITRDFLLVLNGWRDGISQAIPLAPVSVINAVTIKDVVGTPTLISSSAYFLRRDLHRPKIVAAASALPSIPAGGTVEIGFTAGFGAAWANVPDDLAQAVLLLAAQFHENRHDSGERSSSLPFGVMALIERWRTVRVLGGGEA